MPELSPFAQRIVRARERTPNLTNGQFMRQAFKDRYKVHYRPNENPEDPKDRAKAEKRANESAARAFRKLRSGETSGKFLEKASKPNLPGLGLLGLWRVKYWYSFEKEGKQATNTDSFYVESGQYTSLYDAPYMYQLAVTELVFTHSEMHHASYPIHVDQVEVEMVAAQYRGLRPDRPGDRINLENFMIEGYPDYDENPEDWEIQ